MRAARIDADASGAQTTAYRTRRGRASNPPVIEKGRLGFFMICRGGIDAGQIGFDGMQHTGRISIQRRHSQAALRSRTNELPAQPVDEPLPGFDVHHVRPDARGIVSYGRGG